MPDQPFFSLVVVLLALSGLLFLFNLNLVLARLGEMLPDETLRQETRQFTVINRGLLVTLLLVVAAYVFVMQMPDLPVPFLMVIARLERMSLWSLMMLVLLPLSLTMALIWKTKEVILESVFGAN